MSYLAIARKYRPGTFADIVGQEHVVRTLQNAIASGRIHHAYLFCGARGVGKTTAARALAKALNCVHGPTASPCGECTSCVEIVAGSSPDLIEIDGASNNGVEDVRELRDTVGYAPTRGKYKVYLIDEVHMLSKAAFNALLKTLEEPPPHVVFIFATTEANRILDTILSRVQRFDFKRIPVQAVADRLGAIAQAEGVALSQSALRTIARAGEGSMRDAQSMLDKVIASASGKDISDAHVAETLGLVDRALLLQFLDGMVHGKPDQCLDVIARVYDYGYELSEFSAELLELVRNATFVRLSERARAHVDVSADELQQLEAMLSDVSPDALTRLFHALLDTHDLVSRASRTRIVLDMAVARLATVRPVESVTTLVSRLEEIDRRLRAAATGSRTNRPAPRDARAAAPPPPKAKAEPPAAKGKRPPEPPPPEPPFDLYDDEPVADPLQRWAEVAAELKAMGGGAARLGSGTATIRGDTLLVRVPGGRVYAEARRARATPEVEGLLRRKFPRLRGFDVELQPGTGTSADRELALRQQVVNDPDVKRILEKLGAEVESVVALDDEKP